MALARTQSTARCSNALPCAARGHAGRRARTRGASAGFTLSELMVVVVIMGILATLGFASLTKQVKAAWSVEGLSMVQSIRAAQERYRAEHMIYLDVSRVDQWYPHDPRDGQEKHPFFYEPGSLEHPDQELWLMLRPTVSGPVRFGYLVNAGNAGTSMTVANTPGPAVTWPTPPDNWFVIQAIGDSDGDGDVSYLRASSLNGDVFVQNSGE